MQILEIYIHTIIYIDIHTYTTSSTTTTHHHPHHPHHRGEGGTDTFIYIHIQLLPPPPPPPPTTTHTTGGRGVHHHPPPPTPQGGGGYWGATIQTHNHGVGGGEVPSDLGPYILLKNHSLKLTVCPSKQAFLKKSSSFLSPRFFRGKMYRISGFFHGFSINSAERHYTLPDLRITRLPRNPRPYQIDKHWKF